MAQRRRGSLLARRFKMPSSTPILPPRSAFKGTAPAPRCPLGPKYWGSEAPPREPKWVRGLRRKSAQPTLARRSRQSRASVLLRKVPIWRGKPPFATKNADETRNIRLAGGPEGIRTADTVLSNLPLISRRNFGRWTDQSLNRECRSRELQDSGRTLSHWQSPTSVLVCAWISRRAGLPMCVRFDVHLLLQAEVRPLISTCFAGA